MTKVNCNISSVLINYRCQYVFLSDRSIFLATTVPKRACVPQRDGVILGVPQTVKSLKRSLVSGAADAAGTPPLVNLFPIQRKQKKRKCFSSSWQKVEADTFP